MKPQDLQKLIEELEKSTNYDESYLGIFFTDKHDEEAYLKANKRGLEMTAALFLRAILEYDNAKIKKTAIYLGLKSEKTWIDDDSQLTIDFIEIVDTKPALKKEYKPKWYDPLPGYGCIAIVIFTLIAAIIGFITIGKWLFN